MYSPYELILLMELVNNTSVCLYQPNKSALALKNIIDFHFINAFISPYCTDF